LKSSKSLESIEDGEEESPQAKKGKKKKGKKGVKFEKEDAVGGDAESVLSGVIRLSQQREYQMYHYP
jgi:hypothetical protein